jgi:hypothetical protein
VALIVAVHGIAQQQKGSPELLAEWWPSLQSGVSNAKRLLPDGALACPFHVARVDIPRSDAGRAAERTAEAEGASGGGQPTLGSQTRPRSFPTHTTLHAASARWWPTSSWSRISIRPRAACRAARSGRTL